MSFRFVILGDVHVSTRAVAPAAFAAVVARVVERAPRFVVLAGDATSGNPNDGRSPETVQSWWEALEAALAPFAAAGIPVLPIAGNHDSYTAAHRGGYHAAWADVADRVHPLALVGDPPHSYSVRVEGLHLALIRAVDQGIDRDVERWLRADLAAAADAELRLAVGHVPLRSAMGRTSEGFVRQLGGLLVEHGVAGYFAGHEHLVWDDGVDVGSGSLRQVIVGTPGARYTFPLRASIVDAFCRGDRGWSPWSRRSFAIVAGGGEQVAKVAFAEITVDGPRFDVAIHAVDAAGALRPFFDDRPPPRDVEALIDRLHLQRGLNRLLGAGLVVDGVDGPATREAVRIFQSAEGLTADGLAGPSTRARLAERLAESDAALVGPVGPATPPGEAPLDVFERLHEEEIRWLQMALNRLADAGLAVDGRFGARSRAALEGWQRDHGLAPTGVPDDETMSALRAAFEALADPRDDAAAALLAAAPADDRVDTRDEARWLQAALNHLVDAGLVVDGVLGAQSRAAVRSFQRREGLAADGVAGRLTVGRIKARLRG
ncbi:MAG: peptidoglycan-binding protein [Myxococcales bacterium]|nr:peptidoglycan-binding protein [Myxococcales bacterium]